MATVDFYHVEAGLNGVLSGDGIFLDNVENFTFVEWTRCRVASFEGIDEDDTDWSPFSRSG